MKSCIILIISFIILTAFSYETTFNRSKTKLKCILTSNKTIRKIGESAHLVVQIINYSKNNIYLIGDLDGSEYKLRMPYCFFTIKKPKPDTIRSFICGVANPLEIKDFKLVEKGEIFYPYEKGDIYLDNKEFKNPGVYKIRFHYSTNSESINEFLGSMAWENFKDSTQLKTLFEHVPKVDIVSNEIEIKFEE